MSKAARKLREAFAQLDAAYAELPTMVCRGKCSIACGPIPLTDLEARRLQLATHQKPRVVNTNRCVYLTPAGRCGVYAIRPLICRAWGLVKLMSCMHGCLPNRWLREDEFLRVAQQIEAFAGGRVLRTGPQGLEHADGESYARFGPPTKSAESIDATGDRTRGLRALHGGYIVIAQDTKD